MLTLERTGLMNNFNQYAKQYLARLFDTDSENALRASFSYCDRFLQRIGMRQGAVFVECDFLFPEDANTLNAEFVRNHVKLFKVFMDKDGSLEIELYHSLSCDTSEAVARIFIRCNEREIVNAWIRTELNYQPHVTSLLDKLIS